MECKRLHETLKQELQMDWIKAIESFHKVVEHSSFARAAEAMHTTQSSISKRIQWLEDQLDTQLLKRSTRELNLSEAGEMFLQKTKPFVKQWHDIKSITKDYNKEPQGDLRIGITVATNIYLEELFCSFLKEFEKVDINFLVGSKPEDLLNNNINILITQKLTSDSNLTGLNNKLNQTLLYGYSRAAFASPEYIKKSPTLKTPEDLKNHNCLINTRLIPEKTWLFDDIKVNVNGNFKSNNTLSLIKAAIDGMGIIWVPESSISQECKAGLLKRVLPNVASKEQALYAYTLKAQYTPSKIIAFLKYASEFFSSLKDPMGV
jgi:DNA-binding transcriptional LysR family regulator